MRRHIPGRFSDPKNMYYLGGNRIACIGPVGINKHIYISDLHKNKEHQNIFHSQQSVRWAAVLGDQILVSDGTQCRAYPADIAVSIPQELITAENILIDHLGIGTDRFYYPWQ